MADVNYKVDKFEVMAIQQQRASDALAEIEKNCELAPVAFLKSNFNFKKIRDRKSDPDFKLTLSIALVKICGFSGIKSEIDDFDAEDINKMIKTTYSNLTIEEIYKAFEMERYGTYEAKTEHYNLFNADYVATVLKKYKVWKQNAKIHHNITPEPIAELPSISESEKKNIMDKAIIRVFYEYKNSINTPPHIAVMPEPNAYIFDDLFERKVIREPATPAEQMYYQKKYNQAALELEQELKTTKVSSTGELRQIREDLDKISSVGSEKVILRCKKLILADFFNKKIADGVSIESIIYKEQ